MHARDAIVPGKTADRLAESVALVADARRV
jgi:hypothetical protein